MLRDSWNFKNDIAMRLESLGRAKFGVGFPELKDKIWGSDNVECCGYFIEVMFILLRAYSDYSAGETAIDEFIKKYTAYMWREAYTIDNEEAQRIFDEFLTIIKTYNPEG